MSTYSLEKEATGAHKGPQLTVHKKWFCSVSVSYITDIALAVPCIRTGHVNSASCTAL